MVAYLGDMDEDGRLGVKDAADKNSTNRQQRLFDQVKPRWVEVDVSGIRVARTHNFGGPWLGLELLKRLRLYRG